VPRRRRRTAFGAPPESVLCATLEDGGTGNGGNDQGPPAKTAENISRPLTSVRCGRQMPTDLSPARSFLGMPGNSAQARIDCHLAIVPGRRLIVTSARGNAVNQADGVNRDRRRNGRLAPPRHPAPFDPYARSLSFLAAGGLATPPASVNLALRGNASPMFFAEPLLTLPAIVEHVVHRLNADCPRCLPT